MAIYSLRRQVEYADTDMAGIVHFTAFFRYMESAEHAFLSSLGLVIAEPPAPGRLGWPRVSCSFEFLAPLRFQDEIEVRLRIEKLGRRSVTYRADIVCGQRIVAQGLSTSACCRIDRRGQLKAVVLPPAIQRKLAAAMRA
jgi:YbgC/YbaW family acyl-CoA thioester hydrolase